MKRDTFASVLIIIFDVVLGASLVSCHEVDHVGPNDSVALYECDDDGVGEAVTAAVAAWPDIAPIVDRLDVFCVDVERLRSVSICGRSAATEETSCAAWPGTPGPLGSRARIYSARDDFGMLEKPTSTKADVLHELQHLRPSLESSGGCQAHLSSCGWDKETLKRLTTGE